MDGERKINLCEGIALNSEGMANIILTAGKNPKVNSPNSTVIHLKTEKSCPTDVRLNIHTTFSITSSKKIRLLFLVNFLLSIICVIISCSVAFYYCNEMTSMRKQIDMTRDQLLINFNDHDKIQQSPLVSLDQNMGKRNIFGNDRSDISKGNDMTGNARQVYVEGLGKEPIVLVDSSRKNADASNTHFNFDTALLQGKELLVAHFNGAIMEINLGRQAIIGPWVADYKVSSKDSSSKIVLSSDSTYFTIKEDGIFLVYAQIVYLTRTPTCYFLWARQPTKEPRILSTCATGDDTSYRPLDKSQISCPVQTVTRLYAGDTVNLAQREHNKTLWLQPGYSYLGFVKLSS